MDFKPKTEIFQFSKCRTIFTAYDYLCVRKGADMVSFSERLDCLPLSLFLLAKGRPMTTQLHGASPKRICGRSVSNGCYDTSYPEGEGMIAEEEAMD
jgi:hypothetical protein